MAAEAAEHRWWIDLGCQAAAVLEKSLRFKIALHLIVDLIGCRDVLRIDLSHHELTQQLNLLHLGERDFVTDLDRLQIAYRRLVLELEGLQSRLFGLEVLGLRLRRSERAIERVKGGLDRRLRALDPGSRGSLKTRIELLELLGEL